MRYTYHGALLGTLFLLITPKIFTQPYPELTCSVREFDTTQDLPPLQTQTETAMMQTHHHFQQQSAQFKEYVIQQNTQQAVAYALMCKQLFNMTPKQVGQFLSSRDFTMIINKIIQRTDLIDEAIIQLWNIYKNKRCMHKKEKAEGDRVIAQELARRQAERGEHERKQQEQLQKNQTTYNPTLLNTSQSSNNKIQQQRTQALQQTIDHGYQQYAKTYELHPKITGMLMAHNQNYQQFEQLSGTIFQHQLYSEVFNIFNQCNSIHNHYQFHDSTLLPHILEFGLTSIDATQDEHLPLALQLNNLCHSLSSYSLAIYQGIFDGACDCIDMIVDAPQTILHLCTALTNVIEGCINSVVAIMSETNKPLLQRLQEQSQPCVDYSLQLLQEFNHWYNTTNAKDKTRTISRLGTNLLITPRILHKAGTTCCTLINSLPEARALTQFSDVYHEYQLATTLESVGIESIEHVSLSLMKQEAKATSNSIKIVRAIENKKIPKAASSTTTPATNNNAQVALDKKLRALKKAQTKAVKTKHLPDGRIRYYDKERPSKTPGPTRGSVHVTEFNPHKNFIRTWSECYDYSGNINRVHPKMINGEDLFAQHYPPTYKELQFFEGLKE